MHEPEEAKKNFEAILQFDPNNKAASNQVVICTSRIKEQREKDKKLYANIFNRMAESDRKVGGNAWRFGWWDEAEKGVQAEVDLAEIDRQKDLSAREARRNKREEWEKLLKRKGLQRPTMAAVADRLDDEIDDETEKSDVPQLGEDGAREVGLQSSEEIERRKSTNDFCMARCLA